MFSAENPPAEPAQRPPLQLFLLGAPRLELAGAAVPLERRKALALLAYLTVTGQAQPRDALAALLWPEANAAEARAALRRTLSVLNSALGGGTLDIERDSIAVRPGALWADALALRDTAAQVARRHPAPQPPCGECLAELSDAAVLYRGDFLAGFSLRDSPDFDEWQFQQSETLRRELAETLEALTTGYAAEGDYRAALEPARRWVALDPLHEPAQRALIKLYAWAGQSAAAQRAYLECRRLLEAELGTAPEPETTRLYEAVRAGQAPEPPAASAALARGRLPASTLAGGQRGHAPGGQRANHLPAQTTPLLGRVEELAQLSERLADPACRLVTVFGPGGSGKTRLALQAAAHYGVRTGQPLYFVPLAATPTPDILVAAVAEAIGLSFHDEADATLQLLDVLRDRQLLLVLDNFEHLLPGAGLLADILAQAPGVRVLVTSRERLHLHGEWVLEITGLPYPPDAAAPNVDFYEAVQLFVQSARQARADFVLDDDARPAVVAICRLVEGLPLGLELAAAWTRMLSVGEIAAEITRNVDFLATNRRDVPARQRSLRAAFEHSWALLGEPERQALCRLAVFGRAFGRDAAEQVAQVGLPVLTTLADKSLLRRLPPRAGAAQFELHELVKQFAVEKLAATPQDAEGPRRRHAHYYARLLSQAPGEVCDPNDADAFLTIISTEIENVRAAWDWAVTFGDLEALELAQEGLYKFYKRQSWLQEGKELAGLAARRLAELMPTQPAPDRPRYLRLIALLQCHQAASLAGLGQIAKADVLYQRSLEVLRSHGRPADLAVILPRAGMSARELGRSAEARALMEAGVALARELDDKPRLIHGLHILGYYLGELGLFDEAFARVQEAVAEAHAFGRRHELGSAYNSYGFICYMAGDYARALELLEVSRSYRSTDQERAQGAVTLNNLGYVRSALGQPEAAHALFMDALRVCRETRAVSMIADIVVGLAGLLPLPEGGSRAIELLTFARYSPYSWLETKDRADRWQAERAAALPPEVVAAAVARGRALELDEVVADLLGLSARGTIIGSGPHTVETLRPGGSAPAA
ncbi:MAG: AAA family ATPase [Anaerolineales bacterium]|nr:AAA family ATPase [Anaerolineales bacterium]